MDIILNIFVSVVAFLIILSIVVFVHEFGHYIIGIINKVKVDEFAIGYGKEICGWTDKRGTRWKICALPLGGFVKFFGDEDASSSSVDKNKLETMTEEQKSGCLYFKNVWQRMAVVSAGPIFNYLLAILLFVGFFMFKGVISFSNKITSVKQNSPAEKAGILVNDRIIKIGNTDVDSFDEIQINIALQVENNVKILIDRNGELIEKTVELDTTKQIPAIGIGSNDFIYKKVGLIGATKESFRQVWNITTSTLKALGQIIVGKRGLDDMSGPISIAKYSGEAMKQGISVMIYFMALISVSLGLMNLLPIPILDGGHLMFYIIEAIRRKPLNEKVEETFNRLGFSLLLFLMIFVTIKDVFNII